MARTSTLPANGMPNHRIAITVMSTMSANATTTGGSVLPRMSSTGVSGLTISCSSVPISRSRTTARAVRMRLTSITSVPITAGTL